MTRTVEVFPDLVNLVDRALTLTLAEINAALQKQDQFTIALAGGSTPAPLYAALAKQSLPWEKIQIFWGDERYVPPTHPDSNEGMARRTWLDLVPIPAKNIHGIPTHWDEPIAAAYAYEQTLHDFFHTSAGAFPSIDLVLLGIGPDGHTASLFPHTVALQVCDRLVTVGNKDGQPRITLTIPMINQSAKVMFLVTGANKQTALAEIFSADGDSLTYPARFIQTQAPTLWLLDQPAAEGLHYDETSA
jgi:6-phosphogluconolactonase